MKTKEQIEQALSQVAIPAADLLDKLASVAAAGGDLSTLQLQFNQAAAIVDALRWVLGDGKSSQKGIVDYLTDRSRQDELIDFLDRYGKAARQ